MKLLQKYKSKNNYKTFYSINDEGYYYRFLAQWQQNTNLTSSKLLEYCEDTTAGTLYMVVKTTINQHKYLIEVFCNGKEVSFAIICNSRTNINLLLNRGVLSNVE